MQNITRLKQPNDSPGPGPGSDSGPGPKLHYAAERPLLRISFRLPNGELHQATVSSTASRQDIPSSAQELQREITKKYFQSLGVEVVSIMTISTHTVELSIKGV